MQIMELRPQGTRTQSILQKFIKIRSKLGNIWFPLSLTSSVYKYFTKRLERETQLFFH